MDNVSRREFLGSAGECVAYDPTKVPLHNRSRWLGAMEPFGDLVAGRRKDFGLAELFGAGTLPFGSLPPQRHHRIDLRRAPRRKPARRGGHRSQQQRDG